MSRRIPAISLAALALIVSAGSVVAQRPPATAQDEGRLLRAATSLESRGDFAGAERVLTGLLEDRPTSSGGLFALERVLRARGRVIGVIVAADRFVAADSVASTPRVLKLRVLAEIDSLTAMREAAADWIAADPLSPGPYQEVARIFHGALGAESALAMLEQGREALDDSALFSMDLGDLLVELDRSERAIEEWSRAIGEDAGSATTVVRRIRALEGDPADLIAPLVSKLGSAPTTVARRRAASRMALEVGLEDVALEMAQGVVAELS